MGSEPGECVCCGKVTDTRCKPCADNGLDWMYFCSPEHQRLVWFAHKRVCGKNALPFRWPRLTEKEIERYLEESTFQLPLEMNGSSFESTCRENGWTGSLKEKKARFKAQLEEYKEDGQDHPFDEAEPGYLADLRVRSMRVDAARRELATAPGAPVNPGKAVVDSHRVFDSIAGYQDCFVNGIARDFSLPCWTEWQHIMTIFHAVAARKEENQGSAEIQALQDYTGNRMAACLMEKVIASRPSEALEILQKLALTNTFGRGR